MYRCPHCTEEFEEPHTVSLGSDVVRYGDRTDYETICEDVCPYCGEEFDENEFLIDGEESDEH